jgi:hypothetical protein
VRGVSEEGAYRQAVPDCFAEAEEEGGGAVSTENNLELDPGTVAETSLRSSAQDAMELFSNQADFQPICVDLDCAIAHKKEALATTAIVRGHDLQLGSAQVETSSSDTGVGVNGAAKKPVIELNATQAAQIDALIMAMAKRTGESLDAVKRGVELSVITRGIAEVQKELGS